jgi:hypothetical protein
MIGRPLVTRRTADTSVLFNCSIVSTQMLNRLRAFTG